MPDPASHYGCKLSFIVAIFTPQQDSPPNLLFLTLQLFFSQTQYNPSGKFLNGGSLGPFMNIFA